jgi:hypothetical protein
MIFTSLNKLIMIVYLTIYLMILIFIININIFIYSLSKLRKTDFSGSENDFYFDTRESIYFSRGTVGFDI